MKHKDIFSLRERYRQQEFVFHAITVSKRAFEDFNKAFLREKKTSTKLANLLFGYLDEYANNVMENDISVEFQTLTSQHNLTTENLE